MKFKIETDPQYENDRSYDHDFKNALIDMYTQFERFSVHNKHETGCSIQVPIAQEKNDDTLAQLRKISAIFKKHNFIRSSAVDASLQYNRDILEKGITFMHQDKI